MRATAAGSSSRRLLGPPINQEASGEKPGLAPSLRGAYPGFSPDASPTTSTVVSALSLASTSVASPPVGRWTASQVVSPYAPPNHLNQMGCHASHCLAGPSSISLLIPEVSLRRSTALISQAAVWAPRAGLRQGRQWAQLCNVVAAPFLPIGSSLRWSANTTPCTPSPSGSLTSKAYPFTWCVT